MRDQTRFDSVRQRTICWGVKAISTGLATFPLMKHRHDRKATHRNVTYDFLKHRKERAHKFPPAKWIEFCEICLDSGFSVSLYEARKTFSKYVTVRRGGKQFLVRFSNHPPIKSREIRGDCDFFVGRTNLTTTTTDDAVRAAAVYFSQLPAHV